MNGLCCICHRQGRGFGYSDPMQRKFKTLEACSMDHLKLIKPNIGVNRDEQIAMKIGGHAGGAYLDSIGKTDMATLSKEEWELFLEQIILGYCNRLSDLGERTPHDK